MFTNVIFFLILILNSITEFLPISSTAHNIIIFNFINLKKYNLTLILNFSQLGIILSLIIYFRKTILDILKNFLFKKETRIFCYKVILSTLPTLIFGIIFYKIIKNFFYQNFIIAIFLLLGGIIMLFIENILKNNEDKNTNFTNITYKQAFYIGLCQMFSLLPGVSRSASTICGGIYNNLSKNEAIEYSFFLSIPISILACLLDLYKNKNLINFHNYNIILSIFVISFIFSLFFCKIILRLLKKIDLKYFGYYRVIIALLILLLYK